MPPTMPDQQPAGRDDVTTLRWAVRSDGVGGFVFVNNYERLKSMPAKKGVQFTLQLASRSFMFPAEPATIPADSCFLWPFNFDLGRGVRLAWATAQPICAVDDDEVRTVFFAETTGVPAQFAFEQADSGVTVRSVEPGRAVALTLPAVGDGRVQIVLLSDADSLALWKGTWQGRDRVFLTRAGLIIDGDMLRLASPDPAELTVGICPTPVSVKTEAGMLEVVPDGVFARCTAVVPRAVTPQVELDSIQTAGPPRTIPLGAIRQAVAAAPEDADFKKAAVWRIKLPADLDMDTDPIASEPSGASRISRSIRPESWRRHDKGRSLNLYGDPP
jgi:beta-galactosidase